MSEQCPVLQTQFEQVQIRLLWHIQCKNAIYYRARNSKSARYYTLYLRILDQLELLSGYWSRFWAFGSRFCVLVVHFGNYMVIWQSIFGPHGVDSIGGEFNFSCRISTTIFEILNYAQYTSQKSIFFFSIIPYNVGKTTVGFAEKIEFEQQITSKSLDFIVFQAQKP